MGYFDALTSSSFKIAQDGRKLFFPWGIFGSGYVIGSEEALVRLKQQVKIYHIISLLLIINSTLFMQSVWTFAITTLLVASYVIWVAYLLRGLQKSEEGLSLQESLTNQAHKHSIAGLWLLAITSLTFVATGVFVLMIDPTEWLTGIVSIVFFGLCAMVMIRMIVLRRRTNPQTSA